MLLNYWPYDFLKCKVEGGGGRDEEEKNLVTNYGQMLVRVS